MNDEDMGKIRMSNCLYLFEAIKVSHKRQINDITTVSFNNMNLWATHEPELISRLDLRFLIQQTVPLFCTVVVHKFYRNTLSNFDSSFFKTCLVQRLQMMK